MQGFVKKALEISPHTVDGRNPAPVGNYWEL